MWGKNQRNGGMNVSPSGFRVPGVNVGSSGVGVFKDETRRVSNGLPVSRGLCIAACMRVHGTLDLTLFSCQ